jgi:FkbM family methyltransferase
MIAAEPEVDPGRTGRDCQRTSDQGKPRSVAREAPSWTPQVGVWYARTADPFPWDEAMREQIKAAIRSAIRACGYDLRKLETGCDAFLDIKELLADVHSPVVFDVGANVGQTIGRIRQSHPGAIVHAFEPNSHAFGQLSELYKTTPKTYLNPFALGASEEVRTLTEYTASDMSSLLPRGSENWIGVAGSSDVKVRTIDDYCRELTVDHIDLLKSDTQGFELEVLKGARRMLTEGRVRAIYLEITFAPLYEKLPRLDELYAFVVDHGFDLVSFYKFYHVNGRAGWTDALFKVRH